MTTLTDRYVWAATRGVPEAQRAELERELRERIGDASDALIDAGRSPGDAEVAALTELGDPAALAASYVDRPLQLIGPRYFLTWWRLLKLLLAVVVPIATAGILLAKLLSGASVGEAIGEAIATGFSVAVNLGFWTTLVFAIIERSPSTVPVSTWTPQHLPEVPDTARSHRLGDLIASAVFLVLFAGAIVWQQFFSVFTDAAGQPIPLLDPSLWTFWLPYFLGLLALELLFAVAVYAWGWNWWLAAFNLVLNVAFTVPALWLFTTGQLFNEAYLEAAGWPWGEAGEIIVTIIVTVVVAAAVWDVIDGVIKAARARPAARMSAAA
jgi:hypothetical protein